MVAKTSFKMASNRQPVARGGLWSTTQAPVSKETQRLLKVMMEESKLTNFQRRQLQESMKSTAIGAIKHNTPDLELQKGKTKGESLPTNVNPTSSRTPPRQQAANRKPPPKVMNARHLSGGKRRKDAIDEQKAKQGTDAFVPASGKYISEKDKRKLQNVMAYGEHGKDIDDDKPKRRSVPRESKEEPDIDRFDEVLQEIEERREFLGEMESLGKGKEYRTLIETQISQKIRELELIDKSRSGELRTALEEQEDAP